MNLRYVIDMIICRFTSNFIDLIILRMANSHPNHGVLYSVKLRNISDIQVDNSRRFVKRDLVSTSFKFIFEVK